ncbi:flagellar hook assembly protein FlgD [Endozoicomonas sp. SESOKO1]|uniref:flagellar hook assembly protein FlgD n=1 Tax=Endozoicomonas sp. SESOKO1 TaxID=2828742 RepID=UPI0021473CD1|nr:flagellar hook capping FlgD N-terminal domain-containing protein [Endozoicomonas sp. SESOKO1]
MIPSIQYETSFTQGSNVSSSPSSDSASALSKNFMTLLITQLRHQNPLEPMESGDLLNQLAAMTSVSELRDIHAGISRLSDQFGAANLSSATALLGQDVAIDAGQFSFNGDGDKLSLSFPSPGAGHVLHFLLTDQNGVRVKEAHYQGRLSEPPGAPIRKNLDQLFGALPHGHYWLKSIMDGHDDSEPDVLPVQLVSKANSIIFNNADQTPQIRLEAMEPVALSRIRSVTRP